ncbi:nitroreductase family protein [Inediibacterium massiliense]|uniref:nitroreductase family protein n=1 Tax=Inediibacterium massiliense TaxID=1658111 RepID=UPI0006B5705A|nr:nitroreductase family protein [Inediibacterium massiliense]
MKNLDFIYKRHSVRKFKDVSVPIEDIHKIIEAATFAPSGKNIQNWRFVVISNKEKIKQIANIIENKNADLATHLENEEEKVKFTKFVKYATFFTKAPVLILVYAGPYEATGLDVLKKIKAPTDEIHDLLKRSPLIQSVGAAMENIMLSATHLGYGTCWMTSQNYAAKEIEDFVGFKEEGYFLAAMTPLGVPDGEPKSPSRKPIQEVMTIIE